MNPHDIAEGPADLAVKEASSLRLAIDALADVNIRAENLSDRLQRLTASLTNGPSKSEAGVEAPREIYSGLDGLHRLTESLSESIESIHSQISNLDELVG